MAKRTIKGYSDEKKQVKKENCDNFYVLISKLELNVLGRFIQFILVKLSIEFDNG